MKASISRTSGTTPYESKKLVLDDFGKECTASQCETFSVGGLALIMTVPVYVTERGNISQG